MVQWKKYSDFGRITQLRNNGRELIGKEIYWTEKRDGSNISFWLDADALVHISSHNMEQADDNLCNKVILTGEYPKICCDILQEKEFENCIIYFELIYAGRGPTRIEPVHKKPRLILLDIYNTVDKKYLSYNYCHQVASKFKIPIVKLVDKTIPTSLDDVFETRDRLLKWCKRHRREGVVGKIYTGGESIYFKEKIDLPKCNIRRVPKQNEITLPRMPDDKIFNAIDQARIEWERNGQEFKNPKFGMPMVAKYLNVQAEEHNFAPPNNMFALYQEYLEKKGGE